MTTSRVIREITPSGAVTDKTRSRAELGTTCCLAREILIISTAARATTAWWAGIAEIIFTGIRARIPALADREMMRSMGRMTETRWWAKTATIRWPAAAAEIQYGGGR